MRGLSKIIACDDNSPCIRLRLLLHPMANTIGCSDVAQHFLLSRKAKTLTLASVFRMTDTEAETTFRQMRWGDTGGAAVCPHCGGVDPYEFRRAKGALRFECRACGKDFSLTSGTLFA